MAGPRLEASDLAYDPDHRVLICRRCSYAVQPNALDSHLLRHKVYRADRRRLLANVANLDLPADVPVPPPGLPPVDHLPVFSGYRCTTPACDQLTVSSKRMKRHWSEVHGSGGGPVPDLSSIARPVALQTFFRGTKTRYFEVSADCAQHANIDDFDLDLDDDAADVAPGPDPYPVPQQVSQGAILTSPPVTKNDHPVANSDHSVAVDLNALVYFHHFTTIASATLPNFTTQQGGQHFAQTLAVAQALKHQWLVSGLLALSAYHMAFLAEDSTSSATHRARAAHLYSDFTTGRDQRAGDLLGPDSNFNLWEAEETEATAAQIGALLTCARRALSQPTDEPEPYASCGLETTISNIQDCVISKRNAVDTEYMPWHLKQLQATTATTDMPSNGPPPVLLNHLRLLHLRIADAVGKPTCDDDVYATLAAIAALAESCELSFAYNQPASAWEGLATWLAKLPAHFHGMVGQHHPAALVVLAHWAAVLVGRAEALGCWVLKGAAVAVVGRIRGRLLEDGHVAVELLEGLTPPQQQQQCG